MVFFLLCLDLLVLLISLNLTLMYNIFVNCYELVTTAFIIYDDISDHLPTLTNMQLSVPHSTPSCSNNKTAFTSNNYSEFHKNLTAIDWIGFCNACNNYNNPDDMCDSFLNLFSSAFNKCFPVLNYATNNKSKHHPWMTTALVASCKKISKLLKKYKKYPSPVKKN